MIPVSQKSEELLAELAERHYALEKDQLGELLDVIVLNWHSAILDASLPSGWKWKPGATNRMLKDFFRHQRLLRAESGSDVSVSEAKEQAVRAAYVAGWWSETPITSEQAIEELSPGEVTRLRNAVEAHYTAITAVDPT